ALYHCPGLHAAATEPHLHSKEAHAQTSWGFDVHHYQGDARTYFYPRANALGGCTAHHAMISAYGADADWRDIAELTGDESWMPARMRAIYKRIERYKHGALGGRFLHYWHWLLNRFSPGRDGSGQRGKRGWLDVTLTDPKLALRDRRLTRILLNAIVAEED